MFSYSLWSGSSSESCAASSPDEPSSEAIGQISNTEWFEQKRGNFVALLRELAIVDARLLPWADRAESTPLEVFLAYMRVEHAAIAAATPEERSPMALQAVDRAAVLLGADTDGGVFQSARNKLARYIQLFSST
jgi:hypothetical protein